MLPWLASDNTEVSPAAAGEASLAQLVREEVLALILRGTLAPGQRLNEPDIATRLGVSRVPVREALRTLESSGLVVARKHAGVFVRELAASEVRHLYEMRALYDSFAGRKAAALPVAPRRALCLLLDTSVRAMAHAARAGDVQAYYRENLHFHWAIVEAAGNPALALQYRGVVQQLHLSRLKNLSQTTGMQVSVAEHRSIARALRSGDSAQAEALLAAHVERAHEQLAAQPAPNPTGD
jgi:DNA-binding GntR family transcriptional regulator